MIDWVILNSIEQVDDEFEVEIEDCLLQLQATLNENATEKLKS